MIQEFTDLAGLKAGDRVQVFDVNGKRVGQPVGGWDGEVVKVGRKLVTIKWAGSQGVFRLDDGRKNDAYGHVYIMTVPGAAEWLRRVEAVQKLRDLGVELRPQGQIATLKLESLIHVLEQPDAPGDL